MTESTAFQSLFEGKARYRNSAPQTSKDAAAVASRKAPSWRYRTWELMTRLGEPMTAGEVHNAFVVEAAGDQALVPNFPTLRCRVSDLVKDGLLEDSGTKAPTSTGCQAVRWQPVPGKVYFERKARKFKPLEASPEVSEAYRKARDLLSSGRPAVHLLAELILQNEGVAHV